MRFTRTKAVVAAAGLALGLAACGDAGNDTDSASSEYEVVDNAADSFDDGTRMKELADDGTIRIGVKYDQPGIGFKGAADDTPVGFDPEMGKILAGQLGIAPEDIEWVETISDNREPFLQSGEVDLVIASYSITPERRQVVGQAGPYYVTGQQLLVRSDSDIDSLEDIKGKEVCSVTGSTSLDNIEAEGRTWSADEEAAFKQPVLDQYEREGHPYYATARLWDDGIIAPQETRRVLGLALSATLNAPIPEPRWGVFRM